MATCTKEFTAFNTIYPFREIGLKGEEFGLTQVGLGQQC